MNYLYLIVGLGNIGKEYEHTRHNMGFEVVDKLADSFGLDIDIDGFHGNYIKFKYHEKNVILLKPSTYMNNSGISVREIVNYFKIPIENILVIHDDMDFEPGVMKLREKGSSAGHNGIKSIIQHLGTEEFKRIRIGIGKFRYDIVDFVLSKPSKEERQLIDEAQNKAVDAIKVFITEGFSKAASTYNKKWNII